MNTSRSEVLAVIPARFASTRFPGKPLAQIQGKPMIQWVYERTRQSRLIDRVTVATDDERIFKAVQAFGGDAVMTSAEHQTGTDRIAEVVRSRECSLVVNVQGDEPLIMPQMIDQAIAPMLEDRSIPMGTLCRRIESYRDVSDPNVVKVVFDSAGFALYFSRAPIPWLRDQWNATPGSAGLVPEHTMYKHIGLYVYRREFLLHYADLPQTPLEHAEKLEQLRVLENGRRIKVVVTEHDSIGVDIPDDLGKITRRLQES